ncbi:MAG: hypothetical protein ABFD98_03960 [Syntrophobacteraceae bacterium]|nr:hypothetical protein [Desulfobacteraceae bacterium]
MSIHILCITRSRNLARFAPLLLVMLLLIGCGKKTMPKSTTEELPTHINDFKVQVRAKGVELSWFLPDQLRVPSKEAKYVFTVLKSDVRWENRNCAECPAAVQQEIVTIDPTFPEQARIEDQKIVWIDSAVAVEHAYRYQVRLHDMKGVQLAISSPIVAKVVPTPPALKKLVAMTDQQGILLQWKGANKDERGRPLKGDIQYVIERKAQDGPWTQVSNIPVKASPYLDQNMASEQAYDYRVTPMILFENTVVLGEPAVSPRVKSPGALPPPPPKTVWVVPTSNTLEVQWTESEGKVAGYHVYRREGKELIRLTSSPVKRPPFIDRSVKRNVVYYYAVSAVSTQQDQREGLLSKWTEIKSLSFE